MENRTLFVAATNFSIIVGDDVLLLPFFLHLLFETEFFHECVPKPIKFWLLGFPVCRGWSWCQGPNGRSAAAAAPTLRGRGQWSPPPLGRGTFTPTNFAADDCIGHFASMEQKLNISSVSLKCVSAIFFFS